MDITVIIPIYNEEGNIGELIKKVRNVIGDNDQIIVVDDGSTDNSLEELDSKICIVLNHKLNMGKGKAMRTGISAAQGELTIFMGGDGQDDPKEIPILVNKIKDGADFVIGSRFLKDIDDSSVANKVKPRFSNNAVRPINEIGNRLLTCLINFFFGLNVTDSQAEFKCFRTDKLKALALVSDKYEIETEMLIRSSRANLHIAEVPVHRYERLHGRSNLFEIPFGRLKFSLKVLKTILIGVTVWR